MQSTKSFQIDPKNYTVLVIDDTTTNLQVITDYLNAIGFRALSARNGESGLQRAQHGRPDLILLDVLMPGIDGFETCRRLKLDERTRDIPVIFMTALDETKDKLQGFAMGAVDYVTKPVQQEEILARVRTHLSIRDLTQRLEQLVQERTQELESSLKREQELASELRQALDKETELNTLKSKIIEVVSHEFRTPLAVISQSSGLLRMFSDRISDEKRERQFSRIEESVAFIDKLISDVSFVNSVVDGEESNNQTLSFTQFSQSVMTAVNKATPRSGRTKFIFKEDDATITTDVDAAASIVTELVKNALKFSAAPKHITITIAMKKASVQVEVEDSGIGVPADDKQRIFDPFYRAPNVDAQRGLGLGLYIAERMTSGLGGQLVVSSELNVGSTFTLRIPLLPPQAAATNGGQMSPERAFLNKL